MNLIADVPSWGNQLSYKNRVLMHSSSDGARITEVLSGPIMGFFLIELCDLIGVSRPDPAGPETEKNDYVFERSVRFRHEDGTTSPGRIDLYKKVAYPTR
jgi:hypothetical protein